MVAGNKEEDGTGRSVRSRTFGNGIEKKDRTGCMEDVLPGRQVRRMVGQEQSGRSTEAGD